MTSLLNSKTDNFTIHEIYVISDSSTDKTDEIIRGFSEADGRVRFIKQARRGGKAHSVNTFLNNANGGICILSSADIAITDATVRNLCVPLIIDDKVGMTGCNPVPLNEPNNFLGYIIHFWWFAHNRLPRFGEMIAFRNIIKEIDSSTAVDEALLEGEIYKRGFKIEHVSEAIVYNLGAKTISDLLKQRKRINMGHVYLKNKQGYAVNSLDILKVFGIAVEYWRKAPSLKHTIWLAGGALLEAYCRISAWLVVSFCKHKPFIWEIALSTKEKIIPLDNDLV